MTGITVSGGADPAVLLWWRATRCVPALLELQGQGSQGLSRAGGGKTLPQPNCRMKLDAFGAPGCHQGFQWSNDILPDTF